MTVEAQTPINWRGILITGLAYGGGLMLGDVLAQVLFSVLSPEPYGSLGEAARLVIGIVIVMVVIGLAGAIGGFLGGWALPIIGEPRGRYGYAWRSAISIGLVYGTFLLLAVFALSTLTMRDAAFMPPGPFMNAYLFIGLIFGAFAGAVLGLITVGWRKTGSVFLASVIGFAVGGAALGLGIWAYLGSAPPGGLREGTWLYLLLGLFGFGFFGGLAIGFAFDRLRRRDTGAVSAPLRPWIRYVLIGVIVVLSIQLLIQLRPLLSFAVDILTPRASLQTETIAMDAVGTHWSESSPISSDRPIDGALDLAAGAESGTAVVWPQVQEDASDVYVQLADGTDTLAWEPPINVSNSSEISRSPSVDLDSKADAHIAWLEGELAIALYAKCSNGECALPEPLGTSGAACPSSPGSAGESLIEIASGADDRIMTVWSDVGGGLHYRVLPDGIEGCVPLPENTSAGVFTLSSQPTEGYALAFDDLHGSVWLTSYEADSWSESPQELGAGFRPGLNVTQSGDKQVAWCLDGGGIQFWTHGQAEALSQLSCLSIPSIAVDGDDLVHVTWQSGQVEDVVGSLRQENVLYETIGDGGSWTEPAIVATLASPEGYGMVSDGAGGLHMAWTGSDPPIHYARQMAILASSRVPKPIYMM